ncbi:heavy metal translocating P-type ATPase [Turicibacter sanguinis]|uniref:heavy metal translocating P-type ATPase n=1 Tax=Turicibacter sanguinis TaxID=154288 RepID=UPI00241E9B16|nr:heavy metal translocating P-type ATPase [Turicibacter sanguinis]
MGKSNPFKLMLEGLNCANCANKIEERVNRLELVEEANLNFSTTQLIVKLYDESMKSQAIEEIKSIVKQLEPDVVVSEKTQLVTQVKQSQNKEIKLLLEGLNCANCANKIEDRVNQLASVESANLNFSTSQLSVTLEDGAIKEETLVEIKSIINKLEPDVVVSEKVSTVTGKISSCQDSSCSTHDHDTHEHSHEHFDAESGFKGFIKENIALLLGVIVFIITSVGNWPAEVLLYAISYLLIGGNVLTTAFKNIMRGEFFDENFLMMVATVGAFAIGEYPEAIAVMLFYEIGELFQGYAVNRSRNSISSLLDIRADHANLVTTEGVKEVSPEEVSIDDVIIVKPGERVPLDGIVVEGESYLDTSALTGESVPRLVHVGEEILAGCINTNALVRVRVSATYGDSTVARILELVENASSKKAQTEKFITKFARVYTPIVVLLAVAIAIIPSLIFGADFSTWLYRALVFLVVSCPCALVVSIPLGFFAGLGGASSLGVLIKGGNYLEALNHVETVVFDKTGTLTKGVFKVTQIHSVNMTEEDFIQVAAHAESHSTHPIAKSIVVAYGKELSTDRLTNYEDIAGQGIKVKVDDQQVLIGNATLMQSANLEVSEVDAIGTIIHMAINGEYKGYMVIADEIKESSKAAIAELKKRGVSKVVMLTGDHKSVADKVAKELGIDEVYSQLLPHQKVEHVEALLAKKSSDQNLVFVGDGMNDAPVLARADIGVAMGGIGSDAAIEAADVVLMKDDPMALVDAIVKAKQTSRILYQNIIFALGVKILVMILGALGFATMWAAVFADVGVTILAVMNSTRALKRK